MSSTTEWLSVDVMSWWHSLTLPCPLAWLTYNLAHNYCNYLDYDTMALIRSRHGDNPITFTTSVCKSSIQFPYLIFRFNTPVNTFLWYWIRNSNQIINWKQSYNLCLGKFTLSEKSWDLSFESRFRFEFFSWDLIMNQKYTVFNYFRILLFWMYIWRHHLLDKSSLKLIIM